MSFRLRDIRQRLYLKVPGLGFASTAENIVANGIVDAKVFLNTGASTGDFADRIVVRPNQPLPDLYAPAGEVDGDTLVTTGSPYANDTDLEYEVIGMMTADELNDCIRQATRSVYFPTEEPLSPWDGDLFASIDGTAALWTGRDVNGVSTMSTLPADNFSGFATLVYTTSGAGNGYAQTPSLYVSPGERLRNAAINRVTGNYTATWRLMGYVSGAWVEIGSAMSHKERNWQHLQRVDTVPLDCYEVRCRLQGVESGAVVQWDCLPGHNVSWSRFNAPAWAEAGFQIRDFAEAEYIGPQPTGAVVGSGQERRAARSRQMRSWKRPSDYELEVLDEEANPQSLQVNRDEGLPERDMWYVGLRPFSDRGALVDETSTTDAPENLLIPACLAKVSELLYYRFPEEEQWKVMWQTNQALLSAQRGARAPAMIRPKTGQYTPGGRASGQSLSW